MTLLSQLQQLEASGLVRLVSLRPEFQYAFRHALVQQAAYQTLVRQDRRNIHRAVGETLEDLSVGQLDDLAPELGEHFLEAGDKERAQVYFTRAAETATGKYANREAVALYTRAITAGQPAPLASLHHARGLVYDLLGDFERATADLNLAAQQARSAQDRRAEWQTLLSLALVWAGRDYARTGEYCRLAYDLARTIDEPALLARSLNRLGNWHLNVEQPAESRRYHEQALDIFQRLADQRGIAETLDLLAMTSVLSADLRRCADYYSRAVELHRQLGNRQEVVTGLATWGLCAGGSYVPKTTRAVADLRPLLPHGELALQLAHDMGWKAGEVYAMHMLVSCLGPLGEYKRAFALAEGAVALATQIDHRQWMAAAHDASGRLRHDLHAWDEATVHFEQGRQLAVGTGSLYWTRMLTSALVLTYMAQGRLTAARQLLEESGRPGQPQTLGERHVACAWAELLRAEGEWEPALAIVDDLIRSAPPGDLATPDAPIPYLAALRGNLLISLDRAAEAEAVLRPALLSAERRGERNLLWRMHGTLARALRAQGSLDDAGLEFDHARRLVLELAAAVPDARLRYNFVASAHSELS